MQPIVAKASPVFAGLPDADHAEPLFRRAGDVDHEPLGRSCSQSLCDLPVGVPRGRDVLHEGVAHCVYASSTRLSVPPLPSQVAFKCSTARAFCFETNLPMKDQTVREPVLL